MKRLILLMVLLWVAPSFAQELTLAQLRYRTALKLGEDTTATTRRWSNAELNTWINDGITYISKATLCYERDTTYAAWKDTTEYVLPVDFIRVAGVKMGSKGSSSEIFRSPIGLTGAATSDLGKGVETTFDDSGEETRLLTLSPAPEISDSMTVTYFAYMRWLLHSDSVCHLPRAYQVMIPDYAASMAWDRTREPDPYWPKFIERLAPLIQSDQKYTQPENPRITPEPNP